MVFLLVNLYRRRVKQSSNVWCTASLGGRQLINAKRALKHVLLFSWLRTEPTCKAPHNYRNWVSWTFSWSCAISRVFFRKTVNFFPRRRYVLVLYKYSTLHFHISWCAHNADESVIIFRSFSAQIVVSWVEKQKAEFLNSRHVWSISGYKYFIGRFSGWYRWLFFSQRAQSSVLLISDKAGEAKWIEKRSARSRLIYRFFFIVQNNQLSK